jgi:hypothetical protein
MIKKAIEKRDNSILPTPKSFDSQTLVIAPKGVKGDKAYEQFFNKNQTKACLMIEKEAVNKKIKGE